MATLFLHVGHDKTGSSFLQGTFANSIETLKDAGIEYPMIGSMRYAKHGKITTGNMILLHELFKQREIKFNQFYSSEFIFRSVNRAEMQNEEANLFCKSLKNLIEGPLFEKTKLLMFIRNPIAYVCSKYQQQIKRGGYTFKLEDFMLRKEENPQKRVKNAIEYFCNLKNCELEIINYSRVTDHLKIVQQWLNLPSDLNPPMNTKVNRSLSYPELELQKALNKKFGQISNPLSDFWVNRLPDIAPAKICPDMHVQQQYIENCMPDIEWINARVRPEHRYIIDYIEPETTEQQTALSTEQYEVVAEWIAEFAERKANEKIEAYKAEQEKAKKQVIHFGMQ
jgi:hypothetical protein